jgi:KDO2-lipid IV(A) lauroyltransferase
MPKRRAIARENLRRAFPQMPPEDLDRHVRETFRHIGIGSMEMLRLDLLQEDRDLQPLFRFHGLEHLREAYRMGKGVFLLTGHIGFWEVGTFFLPKLGFPVDFIAKPMKNPWIDQRFLHAREAAGGRCIDSRHAARKIVRSLAENRGVAVLLDQHTSKKKAVSVDFFGRPAYTTPVIAQLAMKYGVPVVPVFVYRTPENRYEVEIEPLLLLGDSPDRAQVVANTALLTARIEAAVRRNIDQWFWVHRRWRE